MDEQPPPHREAELQAETRVSAETLEQLSAFRWRKVKEWCTASRLGAVNTAILTLIAISQGWLQCRQGNFEQRQRSQEIRVDIGTLWREGFDKARNRVTRFQSLAKQWEPSGRKRSLQILTSDQLVVGNFAGYDATAIKQDKNLRELISSDLEWEKPLQSERDIVKAAVDYRTTLIQALNTMETVKAILDARHITEADDTDMEKRYRATIHSFTNGLYDFIEAYRANHPRTDAAQALGIQAEEATAWYSLTKPPFQRLP